MNPRRNLAVGLTQFWQQHVILLTILVFSGLVRLLLSWRGGQLFWPDEYRYFRSVAFSIALTQRHWGEAFNQILLNIDHTGFTWVGLLPALLQRAVLKLLGMPLSSEALEHTAWVPALCFSLASVLSIALVYAIARRVGASPAESTIAAVLLAASNTMFYYARHLFPYDTALVTLLLALWIGLAPRWSFWRSLLCGLIAGLGFLNYNGYWVLALIVMTLHLFWGQRSIPILLLRALGLTLGFWVLPIGFTITSTARGLPAFLPAVQQLFSTAVTDGDFAEGWSVVWVYLWHAEHGLCILWLLGVLGLFTSVRKLDHAAYRRGLIWLGVAGSIYFMLVLGSTFLHKAVVYGRLVRPMVPFLCLTTATTLHMLRQLLKPVSWQIVGVSLALLTVQTSLNFSGPLLQRFPREVLAQVQATYGPVRLTSVLAGGIFVDCKALTWCVIRPQSKPAPRPSRYILLNAEIPSYFKRLHPVPAGQTLLQTPHPYQFKPYQYEGIAPQGRQLIQKVDISIRLVDTQSNP